MVRYTFGEHAGKAVVVTGANGLKLGCAVLATEGESMILPHMLVLLVTWSMDHII